MCDDYPIRFSEAHPEANITVCAFLGDECSTLRMTADIRELNSRYYEPLSKVQSLECKNEQPLCSIPFMVLHSPGLPSTHPLQVVQSLDALLAGPPVKKILFMTSPEVVDKVLRPHWEMQAALPGYGASVLQVSGWLMHFKNF